MQLNEREFERIAEYLDEKLGRFATDSEILMYVNHIESKLYDLLEAESKGN